MPREDGASEFNSKPDKNAVIEQDNQNKKIKQLDDEDDADKPKDTGSASSASPAGLNVQLAMPSAAVQYDSLGQGGSKDMKRYEQVEKPKVEGAEVEEEEPTNAIEKLLKLLDKY